MTQTDTKATGESLTGSRSRRTRQQPYSVQEAVAVAYKSATVSSIERAEEIFLEYRRACRRNGWSWILPFTAGIIYEAGRIEGIREERQRRK